MTNLSLEHFENGVKIYQDESLYKFTSDAIKLAKFCKIKTTDSVLDMCAGCGVVGLYAYSIKKFNKLYFNEIQLKMCKLIEKNIKLNNLENNCKVLCKNLNDLNLGDFDKSLDVIVCNPPYFKLNGKVKEDGAVALCRHEIATNLEQIILISSKLIKDKGKLYIIIPSNRLCESVILLNKFKFEVKKMEIYNSHSVATVCLMECVKCGKSGVIVNIKSE